MEIPKRYDPTTEEKKIQEFWFEEQIFKFDKNSDKETYSIDTPPPYVSADHLHVGHAMHYSQFEFVARFQRMRGKNVFFPMGFDDNGLPTERFVEKKHGIDKSKITRPEFVKLCLEETKKGSETYKNLWTDLGISVDWNLSYSTIDPRCTAVSQRAFIDLYKKERIERMDEPTTWCTQCQTSVAQADFENVEMKSRFNDIIFKVGDKELVISTTRPELLPACVALFANPNDERYLELTDKFAKVPLFDYEVPVLFDDSVDKEVGTGLMMVCTFGDKEDVEKWHKYNLPLRIVVNEDGTLNKYAKRYEGLTLKDARKNIIEDLESKNLLINAKPITHAVNVHERCGTEIEFLKKKQWLIKVLDKKEELIEMADKIEWYPEHMKVRYIHWVQNLQWNWNISRQRYYGVPFPVWYCEECGKTKVADYEELPVDPMTTRPKGSCECGSDKFLPETDVMDTWMTSSVSPEINARWGLKDEIKDFFPMSLRPQGHDIIRTWAFYTITKSLFLHDQKPWSDIMISGHGQDPHGRKMSKSKGNVVDPSCVMDKYGADAFRFWAASARLGEDLPYQEKDLVTGTKFINKIWNASKFASMHLKDFEPKKDINPRMADRWMISKLNNVIKKATESFERYEYSKTKSEADKFFFHVLCDNYLEIIKDRLFNPMNWREGDREAAQHVLAKSILSSIKMMAPITPFITEKIYQLFFKDLDGEKSIHVSRWPDYDEELIDHEIEAKGDEFIDLISSIRKFKSENNKALNVPVKELILPLEVEERLNPFLDDLKAVNKVEKITVGKEFKIILE